MQWREHIAALPCLNCEGEPVIAEVVNAGFRLVCADCGNKTGFYPTENEVVDAWNGGPSHREALEKIQSSSAFSIHCIHCDCNSWDWVFRGYGVYVCRKCADRQSRERKAKWRTI